MIVLDTNVISELIRDRPAPVVVAWIASRTRAKLCVTSISAAESWAGILGMPAGARQDRFRSIAEGLFSTLLHRRILPFERSMVMMYAEIFTGRRAIGRPISQSDALIAAIVRRVGGTLATRNVNDFAGCGIDLVDPWAYV